MLCAVRLLAIDPGLNATGYAIFDREILSEAGVIKSNRTDTRDAKAATIARQLKRYSHCDQVIAEWPQVYGAGRSVGDPNDLLWLAYLLGSIANATGGISRFIVPAIWTKGLPAKSKTKKEVNHREERIRTKLSKEENLIMPSQHDVVDAVGIGLYHLDRLKPVRVYPGATE